MLRLCNHWSCTEVFHGTCDSHKAEAAKPASLVIIVRIELSLVISQQLLGLTSYYHHHADRYSDTEDTRVQYRSAINDQVAVCTLLPFCVSGSVYHVIPTEDTSCPGDTYHTLCLYKQQIYVKVQL